MSRLSTTARVAESVARFHWSRAIAYRLERERIYMRAETRYGAHGPLISGCHRDHFPEAVRDRLRGLAEAWSIENRAGWDALARSRRRRRTILRLRDEFETLQGRRGYLFSYA